MLSLLFIKIKVWFNTKQPIYVNILKDYSAMKCDEKFQLIQLILTATLWSKFIVIKF